MSARETSKTPSRVPASKTTREAGAAQSYEQQLEQGYVGGPIDDTDYTVAASGTEEAGE